MLSASPRSEGCHDVLFQHVPQLVDVLPGFPSKCKLALTIKPFVSLPLIPGSFLSLSWESTGLAVLLDAAQQPPQLPTLSAFSQ